MFLEVETEVEVVDWELSDWRPVNDCSSCCDGLAGCSCALREFEAGENRVWVRKERPVGWEGTVSSLSGRT